MPATPSTMAGCRKAATGLLAALGKYPNMIPDLRAYVVFALATTGGAGSDALEKTWGDRAKVSDEGLALIGLALDAAQDAARKKSPNCWRRKPRSPTTMRIGKAHTTECSSTGTTRRTKPPHMPSSCWCAKTNRAACCPRPRCGSPSIATAITGTRPSRPPW